MGSGAFAKCYRVTSGESSIEYAAKVIPKLKTGDYEVFHRKLLNEIQIHSSIKHRNVVEFIESFEDDQNHYIILELCTQKTLLELLQRKKRLSERSVKRLLLDAIDALEYVHATGVIHRDIKLGNLFLTASYGVKLGDFGLATRHSSQSGTNLKRALCGTPNYIAPEIVKGKGYSFEVDVWSLGIVAYTLLVGSPPFSMDSKKSQDLERILQQAESLSFPNFLSPEASAIIAAMLKIEPSQRLLLSDAKGHQFFSTSQFPDVCSLPAPPVEKENIPIINRGNSLIKAIVDTLGDYFNSTHAKGYSSTQSKSDRQIPTHVSSCYDYSRKFGFHYRLSNGSVGFLFNDSTTLIQDSLNWRYFESNSNGSLAETCTFSFHSDPPHSLQKKQKIFFTSLQRYLGSEPVIGTSNSPRTTPLEFALKAISFPLGIIFRLRNRSIQAVISSQRKSFVFVNELKEICVLEQGSIAYFGDFLGFSPSVQDLKSLDLIFQFLRTLISST